MTHPWRGFSIASFFVWLAWAPVASAQTTTVTFDSPAPPAPLNGIYTTREPRNRVGRFTVVGNTANPASEVMIWQNP